MKIILTQAIDTLGIRGDVVEVKNGYGRNYLIPQGMAGVATEGALKRFAEERRQQAIADVGVEEHGRGGPEQELGHRRERMGRAGTPATSV